MLQLGDMRFPEPDLFLIQYHKVHLVQVEVTDHEWERQENSEIVFFFCYF